MKTFRHLIAIVCFSFMSLVWAATVNINTADVDTLSALNGIGPAKAQAIIEYREKNGNFASVDELAAVNGIGEKTLEKLKAELTIK